MDEKLLHNLAVAYAQARLSRKHSDAAKPPTKDELYNFAYDYAFAMEHIESQLKSYPRP